MSQILGYTGPVSGEQLADLKSAGYLPGRPHRQGRRRGRIRDRSSRGIYGSQSVERDASGRQTQVLQTVTDATARRLADADDRHQGPADAQKALHWAMKTVGLKRGVVIAMNPQTGEILAHGQPADLRQQPVRAGDQQRRLREAAQQPRQAADQPRDPGALPTGLDLQARRRHGRARGQEDHPDDQGPDARLPHARKTRFYDWNHRGFGPCDIYCGFGHSSDTFFFQMAGKLGIDRLGYWAKQYGFGAPTGIDLPGEVPGIVPTNQWKQDALGAPIFPGETYQAGIGQGYDVVTPIQLINAYAALANGGTLYQPQIVHDIVGPDGTVVRPFKPKILHKMKVAGERPEDDAQRGPQHGRRAPHLQPRRPADQGRRQVGHGRIRDPGQRRVACRSTPGSSASCPRTPQHGSFNKTDSQLVVLAFAYDSRTKGNVGTEIVKYFLQLHFGIKKDYRLPNLLKRGNFYQSN